MPVLHHFLRHASFPLDYLLPLLLLLLTRPTFVIATTCPATCNTKYSYRCPCRSAESSPVYTFPAGVVADESKRESEIVAAKDTTWISLDAGSGKLAYGATAGGDTIPDFSHVGYHGNEGIALPARSTIAVLTTVAASADATADDTVRIQAALDAAGTATMNDATGYRGAVVLGAGTFRVSASLVLRHDGVVLRGSGRASTTLLGTGTAQFTVVEVLGASRPGVDGNAATDIGRVSVAVPIGSRTVPVHDSASFAKGQIVIVAVPIVDKTLVQTLRMDRICNGDSDQIRGDREAGWTWEPLPAEKNFQWDAG